MISSRPDASARVIAPPAAVRPSRESAQQEENEDDKQNRAEHLQHRRGSCSSKPTLSDSSKFRGHRQRRHLCIPILGQLSPAQLQPDEALKPGPLKITGADAALGVGRSDTSRGTRAGNVYRPQVLAPNSTARISALERASAKRAVPVLHDCRDRTDVDVLWLRRYGLRDRTILVSRSKISNSG